MRAWAFVIPNHFQPKAGVLKECRNAEGMFACDICRTAEYETGFATVWIIKPKNYAKTTK